MTTGSTSLLVPPTQASVQRLVPQPVGLPDTAQVWARTFMAGGLSTWQRAIIDAAPRTEPGPLEIVAKRVDSLPDVTARKPGRVTVMFVQFGKFMHERKVEAFCRANPRYKPIDAALLLSHSAMEPNFLSVVEQRRVRIVALGTTLMHLDDRHVFVVHHVDQGALASRRMLKLEPYTYGFGTEHIFGFVL